MSRIKFIISFMVLAKLSSAQMTVYEYDKIYRLTKVVYANGSSISYQYDANGNRSYQFNVGTVTTTYTFTGNGNWSVPANWLNGNVPPINLPVGSTIIIDPVPAGECVLDVTQTISPGAVIRVVAGKRFKVPGSLRLQKQ